MGQSCKQVESRIDYIESPSIEGERAMSRSRTEATPIKMLGTVQVESQIISQQANPSPTTEQSKLNNHEMFSSQLAISRISQMPALKTSHQI
jgi:hypothetical protein